MHKTAEKFRELAREQHGLELEIEEFPEGTKTAEDAADAIDCELGQIVKSLVMTVDGEMVLVLTSGSSRVDEQKLANFFDAEKVEPASPSDVKDYTGWSIGGVPPFCHENSLPVIMDPSLEKFETVWAAAGTPMAVFSIEPGTLEEIADPEIVDVFE